MSEFKYKIGDRVRIKSLDWYHHNKDTFGSVCVGDKKPKFTYGMSKYCGLVLTIDDHSEYEGEYYMVEDDGVYTWTDEMIEGLVEEETKPKFKVGDKIKLKSTLLNDVFGVIGYESEGYRITNISNGLTYFMSYSIEHYYELVEEEVGLVDNLSSRWVNEFSLPEGYIFKDENGNVINAMKIVLEKKKKEYPKTYEECCKILGFLNVDLCFNADYRNFDASKEQWKRLGLMNQFYQLLICRDAYWKIAGEEMGLEKPWEPIDNSEVCYGIFTWAGEIQHDTTAKWCILTFPTEEMRDAFYENFKELIEQCKELL